MSKRTYRVIEQGTRGYIVEGSESAVRAEVVRLANGRTGSPFIRLDVEGDCPKYVGTYDCTKRCWL